MLMGVFAQFNALSQACLPQGIHFHKQLDVDNFKSDYPNCTAIGGDVIIEEAQVISNLDGLSMITSIGGNLKIIYNLQLDNLEGLSKLTYVGGNLEICYNESLSTLDGLQSLVAVNGNILLNGNSNLVDLGGLRALKSIRGGLEIKSNYSLTVLSGLDNIIADSIRSLTIANNPALSTCEVISVCQYLANPRGTVDIYNNMPGCDNPPEIARTGDFTLPCLPFGNYYFDTQDEIDNFQTDYPACTDLQGDLTISGNLIEDLGEFSDITEIQGDLVIHEADNLRELSGLENLDSIKGSLVIESTTLNIISGFDDLVWIGGSVSIMNNNYATSIEGLNSIDSLKGNLRIWYNDNLTGISGFQDLDYVRGYVEIMHNYNLADLSGLTELDSVKEYIGLAGSFALQDLTGFQNLKKVRGSFSVEWSEALVSLQGLENLATIGGNLVVQGNPLLRSFTGLDNLAKLGGGLTVQDNARLSSFTGLQNLKKITGNLIVGEGNTILDNFSGFDNLKTIGGSLRIIGNVGMVNLEGLNTLVSVSGDLDIENNKSLESLSGLGNLSVISGNLSIKQNSQLTDLTELGGLSAGSIDNLYVFDNPKLTTCDAECICRYLSGPHGITEIYNNDSGCNSPAEIANACGFTMNCLPFGNYYFTQQADIDNFAFSYPGCTDLEGVVMISGDYINNLTGLNQVHSIHGDLSIADNKSLVSFHGLENITRITGSVYISRNGILTNLSGLENIDASELSFLQIYGNTFLSDCAIQSFCDYIAIPGSHCYIGGNADGCMSKQQIADVCAFTFVDENAAACQVTVYPNPAKTRITIETAKDPKNLSLVLFNYSGQEISKIRLVESRTDLDISTLPAGIYFYRIYSAGNSQSSVGRIVKM
jgi:hypothetical protein